MRVAYEIQADPNQRNAVPLPVIGKEYQISSIYLRAGSRCAKAKDVKRLVVAQRFSSSK
jgi:hypothetical protein